MICEGCQLDKTVTVLHAVTIMMIDSRSGRESARTLSRRLCLACGGADTAVEIEQPATLTAVKAARGRRR